MEQQNIFHYKMMNFVKECLKHLLHQLKKSNLGFKFDWSKDVKQLNGKFIGGVFGIEEYVNQNGEVKEARKLTQFRSFDKVDNVSIPKVKTLENGYVSYDDYAERKENNNTNRTIHLATQLKLTIIS